MPTAAPGKLAAFARRATSEATSLRAVGVESRPVYGSNNSNNDKNNSNFSNH